MNLYGFFGYHDAGKDTAASMIPDCRVLKFATPVKKLAQQFLDSYGIEDVQALERVTNGRFRSVRHLQQWICDVGMELAPDLWIRRMYPRLERAWVEGTHQNFAITDCRFRLSYDFIREQQGVAVLVVRPGTGGDGHPSEQIPAAPSEFDYVLTNNRGVDHLRAQVTWMVKETEKLEKER